MPEGNQALFTTVAIAEAFSAKATVSAMLEFEAGLARALASAEIVPLTAATAITQACQLQFFDVDEIFRQAITAGTPAIPLVQMLTARVEGEAKKFVHWGATSQDVIDTALMLQARNSLGLIEKELLAIGQILFELAEQHKHTLMVGRTLLQQALPISFGLKAARWLDLIIRQIESVRERQARSLAVQLGGAAGTLAALGDKGSQVLAFFGQELGLPVPNLPWHTERDRVAEIATTLGIVAGTMSKIAGDLLLLSQTEIGEVSARRVPGKGGSSAMPHKQNPVDATFARAAARLAINLVPIILEGMSQEHERAAGNWQAEWAVWPDLFGYTGGAVARVRNALENLEVDSDRMQANLAQSNGLIMAESLTIALATKLGRPTAFKLVEELAQQVSERKQELSQLAQANQQLMAVLSAEELKHALNPSNYLGSNDFFIEQTLAAYKKIQPKPAA